MTAKAKGYSGYSQPMKSVELLEALNLVKFQFIFFKRKLKYITS